MTYLPNVSLKSKINSILEKCVTKYFWFCLLKEITIFQVLSMCNAMYYTIYMKIFIKILWYKYNHHPILPITESRPKELEQLMEELRDS